MRWILATILVSIPAGWLLWHWNFENGQTLHFLAYESFRVQVLGQDQPQVWTYVLYVVLAVACLNLASLVVASLLALVFPNRQRS
jgi:hypothetical protein